MGAREHRHRNGPQAMSLEDWDNINPEAKTFPPIEIVTEHFRGVGQNFFTLPVHMYVDLQFARSNKTGEEILILLDAAEQAFSKSDLTALEELNLHAFIDVMHIWINKSGQ